MYLIRLDDASDHMNIENWDRMERLLDEYGIKPLVGIIPENRDPMLLEFPADPAFWEKARRWQEKGWRIALHGCDHVCASDCAGINPVHNRSEFAGVPLGEQRAKIREGLQILQGHGLKPDVFFAPSHTFDNNTMEALRMESEIRTISDTVANDVYCRNGFTFIPQQSGRVRKLPFRVSTICLHPNFATDAEFLEMESFFRENTGAFLSPREIHQTTRKRSLLDFLYEKAYFLRRKKFI